MSSRLGVRVCAALFSLALIGVASAASAHVTVSSTGPTQGLAITALALAAAGLVLGLRNYRRNA